MDFTLVNQYKEFIEEKFNLPKGKIINLEKDNGLLTLGKFLVRDKKYKEAIEVFNWVIEKEFNLENLNLLEERCWALEELALCHWILDNDEEKTLYYLEKAIMYSNTANKNFEIIPKIKFLETKINILMSNKKYNEVDDLISNKLNSIFDNQELVDLNLNLAILLLKKAELEKKRGNDYYSLILLKNASENFIKYKFNHFQYLYEEDTEENRQSLQQLKDEYDEKYKNLEIIWNTHLSDFEETYEKLSYWVEERYKEY